MGLFHKKDNEQKDVKEVAEEAVVEETAVEEAVEETMDEAVEESADIVPVEDLAEEIVDHVEIEEPETAVEEDAVEETEEAAEEAIEEVSEEAAEEMAEDVAEEIEETEETDSEDVTTESEEEPEAEPEDESEENADDSEEAKADAEETANEESKEETDEAPTEEDEKALEKEKEENAKERSAIYTIFDTIRYIAIGLLVGILLVVFVIQRNDVSGSSMEPTLHTGDAVFVEMISIYTGNLDRGDIVTIDAKGMDGYTHEENLIKRIIGLPGETIKIADGNVYINGQLLDESDYLPAGTKTYVGAEGKARGYEEITLGPDEYYCMGDNRGGSNDSRRLGPFKKKQIEAKVLMRIYPFNKMKFY